MIKTLKFNSITEIPKHIAAHKQLPMSGSQSTDNEKTDDWCLNTDLNDALAIAEKGGRWDEGAKDLRAAHVDAVAAKAKAQAPESDYSVTGHTLDVGEFLTGNPTHWMTDDEDKSERRPVLSIGVHIGRQGNIDAADVVRRGAAILSVIDDLESNGYRVELYALWANKAPMAKSQSFFQTLVKDADEHWSPSSVAFALCHPAFSRRLMFRLAEAHKETAELTFGYGTSADPSKLREKYDIFFPRQTQAIPTIEMALSYAVGITQHALKGDTQ